MTSRASLARTGRSPSFAITALLIFVIGCGPTDYQKPIQQFSDASAVVAATAGSYLNNMNVVEQEASVYKLAFESKAINLASVDTDTIISPAEIALRSQAISLLSTYISNLASLASGSASSAIGKNTGDLSDSLKKIASDAGALRNPNVDNAKFSGIASAAATAIGAVAQLIVNHKARRDIEASLASNAKPVEDLIDLIGQEMTLAYERQKATLDAQSVYLTQAYAAEQASTDIAKRLSSATKINSYRRQKELLHLADPTSAVSKMKKSFEALIAYAQSDKDPKTIAALFQSVQDFVAAAAPLGQAIQSLIAAS